MTREQQLEEALRLAANILLECGITASSTEDCIKRGKGFMLLQRRMKELGVTLGPKAKD